MLCAVRHEEWRDVQAVANLLVPCERRVILTPVNVKFLDLRAQYNQIKNEIDSAVSEVFRSQNFILGDEVKKCEEEIATYCESPFACGASSGTDALMLALMSEGIGPGDEVITTTYTFFATAGCIARLGATPVFVDINHDTFNLDISKIERVITKKTKAIIVVHLFGQMMDMDSVMSLANSQRLVVIEDAAQAIGAKYDEDCAGSQGDYGCFSFYPGKNLGAAGDAGMVITADEEKLLKMQKIRSHGSHPKYFHAMVGGNFRLDALQAAVIRVKLRYLDEWISARQNVAAKYDALLADLEDVSVPVNTTKRHTYNSYVIRAKHRDELRDFLLQKGVQTQIYYPLPLHSQECFEHLGADEDAFPCSNLAASSTLALPVYPELSEEHVQYVSSVIHDFYSSST